MVRRLRTVATNLFAIQRKQLLAASPPEASHILRSSGEPVPETCTIRYVQLDRVAHAIRDCQFV